MTVLFLAALPRWGYCGTKGAHAAAKSLALTARSREIEVKGRIAQVLGLESPSGFGGVTFDKSDRFAVELRNELSEPTLIHWHGQTPPAEQDGVPDLSQAALSPGASYSYDLRVCAPARTGCIRMWVSRSRRSLRRR